MPYIVTETVPSNVYGTGGLKTANVPHIVSRRAVATLNEAQDAAIDLLPDPSEGWSFKAMYIGQMIGEQGGSIGPPPDGTVIEVERVEWFKLREAASQEQRDHGMTADDTIAAYNAAQEG